MIDKIKNVLIIDIITTTVCPWCYILDVGADIYTHPRHGPMTYANCIKDGNKDISTRKKKKKMYAIIDAVVSTELFVVVYSISIGCLSGMSSEQYFT